MTYPEYPQPCASAAPAPPFATPTGALWKAAGVFCVLSGAQMLAVWPILIATGQVPELHTQTVYMLFHLSSEAFTALLCIGVGLGVLLRARWAPRLYFVCGSMSVTAITLAIAFYLFASAPNKTVPLAVLLTSWVVTVGALVAVHRRVPRSPHREASVPPLFGGALFYVLTNAAGMAAERRDGYSVTYACALASLALISLWLAWRKGSRPSGSDVRSIVATHDSSPEPRPC